jgi:hypothetical protein
MDQKELQHQKRALQIDQFHKNRSKFASGGAV